ncbi:MAG: nucleotidyltransferase family protein [Candidatus Bathyarchaeia archaeon]
MVQTLSPVRSLEDVKRQLQELKPTLRERFKVETIDIFGSFARGEQTVKSDLDILVTYSGTVSLFTIYDLKQYLKRKLRIKVDVISKEFLNKYIKDQVLKEAVAV